MYRFGTCAAEQASARPGSRPISVSRALHVHARGMSCCMHIENSIKNDACTLRMRHRNCRGLCASLSENRRKRRFLGSEAQSPSPAHAMMHGNEITCMKKHARRMVHATMHAHAHAARDLSSFAKRVDGHVFSIENEAEERHKGAIVYLQTIQLFIL